MSIGQSPLLDGMLFPDVPTENWQMMPWERIALRGVLAALKPRLAIEIGVYHGGSLSLIAAHSEHVVAIDNDPRVPTRFTVPGNVDLRIGASADLVPALASELGETGRGADFVLIDADHSTHGVRADIERVLALPVTVPMTVMIHDSGNPQCRAGILSADWHSSRHVESVEVDFVPGQIIEHSVRDGRGEIWGGFALALLTPEPRAGKLRLRQSARTSIAALHRHADG